jgi:hypothetical protein
MIESDRVGFELPVLKAAFTLIEDATVIGSFLIVRNSVLGTRPPNVTGLSRALTQFGSPKPVFTLTPSLPAIVLELSLAQKTAKVTRVVSTREREA